MKDVTILDAIILGIVEGLTEYLPVSSTGHLMVTSALLKLEKTEFLKSFEIVIQSGAILSVLLIYRDRFFGQFNISFYKKIFWAFLPTALVGLILKKLFDHMLGSIWIVAATLIVGGFFLIWMEKQKWFSKNHKSIEDLTLKDCIKLGLFQCVAMLPGTSRSGASIVGGLFLGLKKEEATQFSFFLAVPTLLGASVLKFKDILPYLNKDNALLLFVGWLVSFLMGVVAIKGFIQLVSRSGFIGFGIYRIIAGLFVFYLLV
ncbi:MAG: undecaprenyl-diphosphate phosphatase [Bdellovibrionales bacterium]